jgi:hypothetical protein
VLSCDNRLAVERGAAVAPEDPQADRDTAGRSGWYWLLAVPIVVPLLTPLYNRTEPVLLGFPAFYWLQLAFVGLGVACTVTVYRMTRRR